MKPDKAAVLSGPAESLIRDWFLCNPAAPHFALVLHYTTLPDNTFIINTRWLQPHERMLN